MNSLCLNDCVKFYKKVICLCQSILENIGTVKNNSQEIYFNNLVLSYNEEISRICRSFARTVVNFEDLRQDVLINIWKGLKSFQNKSNIKTWIYKITLNTCVSSYRKHKNDSFFNKKNDDQEIFYNEFESFQWLAQALKSLNPLDRSIMLLWLDDFSYEEISEIVGLNRNTIATKLKRSKEKIKIIITDKNF